MVVNEEKSSIFMALMDPMDKQYLLTSFPFPSKHIDEGFEYLGFPIKPNDYRKKDWDWLVAKIERRINLCSHKWISRVVHLVLIKSCVEAIMVYWASLSWIPKGILEKIRRICSSYLWHGNSERNHLPWVKWDRIAMLKAHGGWGLNNIYLFSKDWPPRQVGG